MGARCAANITLDQDHCGNGGGDGDEEERPLRMCWPDKSAQPEDPAACTHCGADGCCYPARFRTHVIRSPMRLTRIIDLSAADRDELWSFQAWRQAGELK